VLHAIRSVSSTLGCPIRRLCRVWHLWWSVVRPTNRSTPTSPPRRSEQRRPCLRQGLPAWAQAERRIEWAMTRLPSGTKSSGRIRECGRGQARLPRGQRQIRMAAAHALCGSLGRGQPRARAMITILAACSDEVIVRTGIRSGPPVAAWPWAYPPTGPGPKPGKLCTPPPPEHQPLTSLCACDASTTRTSPARNSASAT
jgi:hypothetical protein